jgi:hypothetical protein
MMEDKSKISDGYHTFEELYDHRHVLFLTLCLLHHEKAAWKWDYDGTEWFCLYLELPNGQISYHLPASLVGFVEGVIPEKPDYEFDGHKSSDVVNRLGIFALRTAKSLALQKSAEKEE